MIGLEHNPDQIPAGIGLIEAIVLGLVEGLTEFLPVSSTGHLILANRILDLAESPLTIGIQFGAITAILVLYWERLWQALTGSFQPAPAGGDGPPNLLVQIMVAALPAAVLGLLLGDWIEQRMFSPGFVAATMTIGGVGLLLLESWVRHRSATVYDQLALVPYRTAFWIGMWQCLALLPGTSRSAATIAGALILGLSRTAAAEISFLVGLPILYGACMLEMTQHYEVVTGPLLLPMLVATVIAFLSALVVVRPFVHYLRHHSFAVFAVYRIGAGLLITLGCLRGAL